jgi:hypothetical protein
MGLAEALRDRGGRRGQVRRGSRGAYSADASDFRQVPMSMIGNNSCGATAQRTGKVVDNIAALEVLLYEGTRF